MNLDGRRVAVLAEEAYQELEFWYPVMRFREEGADVVVAAPRAGYAYESLLGYPLLAEKAIDELDPVTLDAVVIPGGEAGTRLQDSAAAIDLVRKLSERGAITAAISSGSAVLARAGALSGRRATGDDKLAQQLGEAGATYAEGQDVVVDGPVITARATDDLPSFFRSIGQALQEK
jgi:protease I